MWTQLGMRAAGAGWASAPDVVERRRGVFASEAMRGRCTGHSPVAPGGGCEHPLVDPIIWIIVIAVIIALVAGLIVAMARGQWKRPDPADPRTPPDDDMR